MLSESRHKRLVAAVASLREIAGVKGVFSDDFDSTGINVFIELKGNKFELDKPLRATKLAIAKVCKLHGGCGFGDQPVMQYEWVPGSWGEKGYKRKVGYDRLSIQIDLYIA